ncbi:hypothetical protein BDQ17DRAFT_1371355 [Cyathus striatus]|nr:hypothetical protein BDQ17DRAFT_1371355 [Cyathus striatus]
MCLFFPPSLLSCFVHSVLYLSVLLPFHYRFFLSLRFFPVHLELTTVTCTGLIHSLPPQPYVRFALLDLLHALCAVA